MSSDENNTNLPDDPILPEDAENGQDQEVSDGIRRRKVRVKVRKKIRIKQKPSAKKQVRKIAERAFWVIIVAGFIISLIIMIVELDVRDEKFKQQRKRTTPVKGQ